MTIRETAEALGLKVRTIRKWVAVGHIKAEKRGAVWFIPESEIMSKEVQERANESRKHSIRIAEGKKLGMLAGRS